ncbi:MAG TPA: nuclear transport factor 2 family protein [Longimicrobiales bacterium]
MTTQNRQTVERYMDAFARLDHAAVLSCLTDDVEWVLPGVYHHRSREAFDREIENDAFTGRPLIRVDRITEQGDVVMVEGRVRANPRSGGHIHLAFVDAFEMRDGRIARLISYLMQVPDAYAETRFAG